MTTATEVRTPPNHDKLTCVKNYHCRRPECVERKRAYGRAVTRRQAYGTWQPYVDAEPVRQHLLALREAKVTLSRVSELTGLSQRVIGSILYDLGDRPRCKQLRPRTAAKILAVTAEHANPDLIDATGTRRRIEALQVIGWPKQYIAQRIGVNVSTAGRVTRQNLVRTATASAVTALYAELKVQLPEDHGILPWVAERARNHARAQGWHGPLAWDGNIDDPNAVPDTTDAPDPRWKRDEWAEQRRDEIWLLHTACLSNEEIATRVGMHPSTVREIRAEIRTGRKRDRGTKREQAAAA